MQKPVCGENGYALLRYILDREYVGPAKVSPIARCPLVDSSDEEHKDDASSQRT